MPQMTELGLNALPAVVPLMKGIPTLGRKIRGSMGGPAVVLILPAVSLPLSACLSQVLRGLLITAFLPPMGLSRPARLMLGALILLRLRPRLRPLLRPGPREVPLAAVSADQVPKRAREGVGGEQQRQAKAKSPVVFIDLSQSDDDPPPPPPPPAASRPQGYPSTQPEIPGPPGGAPPSPGYMPTVPGTEFAGAALSPRSDPHDEQDEQPDVNMEQSDRGAPAASFKPEKDPHCSPWAAAVVDSQAVSPWSP